MKTRTNIWRSRLVVIACTAAITPPLAWATGGFEVSPTSIELELDAGETATEEVCVTVPKDAVIPKVDVYLLADTTGSMSGPLASVKSGASTLAGSLFGLTGVDVAIGVGNYKDFPKDAYAFDHQVDPTITSLDVTGSGGIASWSAGGGYDRPEGQLFALDRLAADVDPAIGGGNIGWRSGAKRIVVWFGDQPGHDPVCGTISGLSYGITQSTVTDDLNDAGITVVAISTTSGGGLDGSSYVGDYLSACGSSVNSTVGQATEIATDTGGSHIKGVNNSLLVTTIVGLVEDEVGSIDELALSASGDAADYVTGIDPSVIGPIDTSSESEHCFDVDFAGACGEEGEETFTGSLDATADGADIGSASLSVTIPACCPADDEKLGAATGYNVFVTGDYDGYNSETWGKVAVGGDMDFVNYGIATKLGSGSGTVLTVGGDLTASSSQIYGGDAHANGTCSTPSSVGHPDGDIECPPIGGAYDASGAATEMQDISNHMADLAVNGTTTTTNWGGVYLSGTDPDSNVFELDLDDLGFASWVWNGWINTFSISATSGSTVIINVKGDAGAAGALFKNGGISTSGVDATDIVWNFNTQTDLKIRNVSVPGSIMAPNAHLDFSNGNTNGTVIVASFSGSGEFHSAEFDGNTCGL